MQLELTNEEAEAIYRVLYRAPLSIESKYVNVVLHKIRNEWGMASIDESEIGCPPGCTNPFCSCPGTD